MAHAEGRPREGVLGSLKASAGELGIGIYSFLLCFAIVAALGFVGLARKEPWVFPSLGPTAILFFETPRQRAASGASTLVGHLVGIGVGAACLYGFGLGHHPPATQEGLTAMRVVAAALSVALTAGILRAVKFPHPPAGASTLIVSLGVLKTAAQLRTMVLAVVAIAVLGVLTNRLLGVRQRVAPSEPSPGGEASG